MTSDADAAVRAIVITGDGPAFSAGGDHDMIEQGTRAIRDPADDSDTGDAWRWIRREFGGVVRTITGSETLFVAAVNGPTAGVGLAFALACDVLIASDRTLLVPPAQPRAVHDRRCDRQSRRARRFARNSAGHGGCMYAPRATRIIDVYRPFPRGSSVCTTWYEGLDHDTIAAACLRM